LFIGFKAKRAMTTKDKVVELVEHIPDTFSVDDLVERVVILEKIEKAQKEINNDTVHFTDPETPLKQ
jgi:hypothetical protein